MTAYAASIARPPSTLTEVEHASLLKLTGEPREGFRDHVIPACCRPRGMRPIVRWISV